MEVYSRFGCGAVSPSPSHQHTPLTWFPPAAAEAFGRATRRSLPIKQVDPRHGQLDFFISTAAFSPTPHDSPRPSQIHFWCRHVQIPRALLEVVAARRRNKP
ncbi:hypothetical protein VTJ04DRAFT_6370 [Mycothermus thermophilus]|uniref:uncharacterized protein n=1 Tax=Humicola insolens TaxID=85995 RepID=UPI0037421066